MSIRPDALCARARQALCEDQLLLMGMNCSWVPSHLPQLCRPDAVFITTCLLGNVKKYTNHAWNRLNCRTVDEMYEFTKTLTTPQPLAMGGLFPLIGVIPAAAQSEVMP